MSFERPNLHFSVRKKAGSMAACFQVGGAWAGGLFVLVWFGYIGRHRSSPLRLGMPRMRGYLHDSSLRRAGQGAAPRMPFGFYSPFNRAGALTQTGGRHERVGCGWGAGTAAAQ